MNDTTQIFVEHAPVPVDHFWICATCNKDFDTLAAHAAHVVAALTNAGKAVVDVPSVAHKGELDTDASAFRQVAANLDRNLYADGSNVRRAVSTLLRNVAAALTDDTRTTSEIRAEAASDSEDYYLAARDSKGNIRLRNGKGLMVANADHTRDDVQGWFDRSQPGQYREQYRAALALIDREAGAA